jgi:hypothetical protein
MEENIPEMAVSSPMDEPALEHPLTEEVDIVFITPPLRDALLVYLKTRPYDEVATLIPALTHSHQQKVTVNVQGRE